MRSILSYVLFAALLGLVTPALAQTSTLEGTIRDADGAPLPGATIQVADTPLGATTDPDGRYRITEVPTGPQTVEARFVGYSTARRLVTLEAGQTTTLDITLSDTALDLDQVVVTADRRERTLRDTPAAITNVTAREAQRRAATTTTDALVGVPGVQVRRDESSSDLQTLTLRGVPNRHGNDTFVALVDGVPYVTGNDEVDLDLIAPPALIDRTEVLRGSTSALYGRGGVSGAINYFTLDAFGQPSVTASVLGGSYGLAVPAIVASIPIVPGRNQLLVSGVYEHRDGWRDETGREATYLFAKNQWLAGPSTAVSISAGYTDRAQRVATGIPLLANGSLVPLAGGIEANYNVEGANANTQFWQTTARVEHQFTPTLDFSGTLHYRDVQGDALIGFTEPFSPERGLHTQNGFYGETGTQTFYAEPQLRARLGAGVQLTAGASYERVDGRSTEDWTGEYGFNPNTFVFSFYTQSRDITTGEFVNRDEWVTDRLADITFDADVVGAYAQADVSLLENRLTLGLGARYDGFRRDAFFAETTTQDGTTPEGTSEDRAQAFSPKLSAAFRLTPQLTTYATFGRGFSPAFGPVWAFRSRDTTLEPERATNAEVGLKGGTDVAQFTLALYRLDRRNLLILVPTEGQSPLPQNAGRQLSQGLEAEARVGLGAVVPGLAAWGSYTYTDSEWVDYRFGAEFGDTVYDFSDNRVAGAPSHQGTLGFAHTAAQFGLETSAWVDASGDYFIDNGNTVEDGAFALVNASVAWAPRAFNGAEVRLTALNLLDQEHFFFFGTNDGPFEAYPGRRREVTLALHYQL
ncbi:MAG: TonB-dependent receptor [Bacteroidota bacterium]